MKQFKMPKGKERIEVIVFASVVVIGLGYAGVRLGFKPIMENRRKYQLEANRLEAEITKIKKSIQTLPSLKNKNAETRARVRELYEAYMPKSVFDSYVIWVKETLRRYAEAANVSLSGVNEAGRAAFPSASKSMAHKFFKLYQVNVSLRCSYADALRFISVMHKDNPYLTVSKIRIVGNAGNVEQHQIALSLWWPILDPKFIPSLVEEELEETL